jgi:lipopolysaccharide transport system ATP-binding protein
MKAPMIEVKEVSKSYFIGHKDEIGSYEDLSTKVAGIITHPIRTYTGIRGTKEVFWALQDVSLSVMEGEVIGLIGRNGAGKSTLLKIVSQITYPTKGKVDLRGRVGSLLEVGTGFHPDLTGRENIYLNGAILGMRKTEIEKNFDDIVKFSELEKFLDTPVKRYSSGMYVRLGFAVAAHLNPEILLLDEVLAVGDSQFQKKCLNKIKDVSQGGRTVLFVSHNMAVVEGLCEKAVLIEDGRLKMIGDTSMVISEYLRYLKIFKGNDLTDPQLKRKGSGEARFTWIDVQDMNGEQLQSVPESMPFRVSLRLKVHSEIDLDRISIVFSDEMGRYVLTTRHSDCLNLKKLGKGEHQFFAYFNPNPFITGSFTLRVTCRGPSMEEYDTVDHAFNLNIVPNLEGDAMEKRPGVVRIPFEWSHD